MPYAKGTPYWIGSKAPAPIVLDSDASKAAYSRLLVAHGEHCRGVVLYGPPGTGKTSVMSTFAEFDLNRPLPVFTQRTRATWLDRPAIWTSAADLVDDIRAEINLGKRLHHEDDADSFTASAIARFVPMLFVDDLGTESDTDFSRAAVESLIDARYRDRDEKQTWFTTNLGPRELMTRYSERTISRLVELCEFTELAGADRRIAKYMAV